MATGTIGVVQTYLKAKGLHFDPKPFATFGAGSTPQQFHAQCDNMGPNVIVAQTVSVCSRGTVPTGEVRGRGLQTPLQCFSTKPMPTQ